MMMTRELSRKWFPVARCRKCFAATRQVFCPLFYPLLYPLLCLLFITFFATQSANAETAPLRVDPALIQIDLANASAILEDPQGKLTLEDVQNPANASRFEHRPPNIGFSSSAFWVRFKLVSDAKVPVTWWLNSHNRTLQEIALFVPDENGVYQTQSASSNRPFADRPLPTSYFVFPVTLMPEKATEIYLRVRSTGFLGVIIAPKLWQPEAYQAKEETEQSQWLLYLGMAIALSLFNLLLCVAIKDSIYFLYVASSLAIVWAISSAEGGYGSAYEYFWPNAPAFEQAAWAGAIFVGTFLPFMFVMQFVELRKNLPRSYIFIQICMLVLSLLISAEIIGLFLPLPNLASTLQALHIMGTLVFGVSAVVFMSSLCLLISRGNRQAKFIFIAWVPIMSLSALWGSYGLIGLKYNIGISMAASTFELITMSLALADRFNQEKKARELAQAAVVEVLRGSELELEEKVAIRTKELQQEQIHTKQLLHNILPVEIATELSETGSAQPARHESVSILFTDFIGFTQAVSIMPADRMVAELNEIFAAFDDITDACGVEKIKTIGDAYMAVAGLPKPCDDHAQRCVRAGLLMVAYLERRNEKTAFKWSLRVGIHSGPVVAGVVGKRKFAFDIWGDTVKIASCMESAGEKGRVNISANTSQLIEKEFHCQYRGKLDTKGKGQMDMYFVTEALQS